MSDNQEKQNIDSHGQQDGHQESVKKTSLSSMVGVTAAKSEQVNFADTAFKLGVLPLIAFLALHLDIGRWLMDSWKANPNWSHGPLIPLFSAYLLYARWDRIKIIPAKISWVGFVLFLAGVFSEAVFAYYPVLRNHSLHGLAMVVTIFGIVLFLCGWRLMKYLWLPVLFLTFAVPLPGSVYTKIAYPLQELAAFMSVGFYKIAGVEIIQQASTIYLTSVSGVQHELTVAEACSGMNLLVAFLALAVAIAYLDDKPVWQRVVLVLAGVPIAVFCNILRVIITCYMYYIDHSELGQGFMHEFTGMIMLIPAFGMLWLLSWLLKRIFVEQDQDETDDQQLEVSGE